MRLQKITATEFKDLETKTIYEIVALTDGSTEEAEKHVEEFLRKQIAVFLSTQIHGRHHTIT